jgi:hypothetical protein
LSDEESCAICTFNSSEGEAVCVVLVDEGSPVDCAKALNEGAEGPPAMKLNTKANIAVKVILNNNVLVNSVCS